MRTEPGEPSASAAVVPCLGPRLFKRARVDPSLPTVVDTPSVLTGDKLTMKGASYDGVVHLTTQTGSIRALKFSMDKAVTKSFELRIAQGGGASTVIAGQDLTVQGNVQFFATKIKGRLFGFLPLSFSPSSPPPFILPSLWFKKVRIELACVSSDTMPIKLMRLKSG
jgi:hypothetical protein